MPDTEIIKPPSQAEEETEPSSNETDKLTTMTDLATALKKVKPDNVLSNNASEPGEPDTEGEPGEPDTEGEPGEPDTEGEPGEPDIEGEPGEPDIEGWVKSLSNEEFSNISKLFKINVQERMNDLHKQRETAKTTVEQLQQKLQKAHEPLVIEVDHSDPVATEVNKATEMADLSEMEQEAQDWADWAEEGIELLRDSGEESIERNGEEYSKEQLRIYKRQAQRVLKRLIPQRQQMLKKQNEAMEGARELFPYLREPSSDLYKRFIVLKNHKLYSGLNNLSNGHALLAAGIYGTEHAMQAREGKDKISKREIRSKLPSIPKSGGIKSRIHQKSESQKSAEKKQEALETLNKQQTMSALIAAVKANKTI